MSKVIADPASIRELASAIQRGQTEIDRTLQNMRAALTRTDWSDERRRQFEQQLESFLRSVASFAKQTDDMRDYLGRKATELEQYLAR